MALDEEMGGFFEYEWINYNHVVVFFWENYTEVI